LKNNEGFFNFTLQQIILAMQLAGHVARTEELEMHTKFWSENLTG
jgi:hypothetical protein